MVEELQYQKMTQTPIPRLIVSLAAPSTLSMLITSIYNLTDTYFVSQLGLRAAAAVGVVFALMSLIQAIGFTIGMGTSSFISRFLGEKEEENANRYASGALAMAGILGSVLAVVGLLTLTPLMRLLGSTETALPYAREYAKYILIGSPVMCLVFVLNNILRAEGHASLSMIGVVSGGILNMILDPILIFGCNLGIAGASIATLAGQITSLCLLMSVFFLKKTVIRPSFSKIPRSFHIYVSIFMNGCPTLCRQGLASVASALLAITAKPYGDGAIAAMTIASKIYTMIRSCVVGIGQGFQPMAGYNYGAGRYDRVRKGFFFTVALGTTVCGIAAIGLAFCAPNVIAWFRKTDAEVILIGARTLRFLCMVLPLLAYSTYVNQMLQCLGKSRSAAFLASCRQGIFFIPLLLLLSRLWGLTGMECTQAAADFLTFCISIPFQIVFFRKGLSASEKR